MVNSEIMNANREYIIAVQTQHFVLCRSYLRVIFFCVCQKRLFCTIRRATYVSINPQLCSTITAHANQAFFKVLFWLLYVLPRLSILQIFHLQGIFCSHSFLKQPIRRTSSKFYCMQSRLKNPLGP